MIGFQANASSRDQGALDGSRRLQVDAIENWGKRMLHLNRRHGIKICSGCCGSGPGHRENLVHHHRIDKFRWVE
ncbi:MAG: hypothetical protein WAL90_01780 [Desulfobacterales bacterium]